MPIISRIGRRTFKIRLAIGVIYTLLIIGAISMIYPMLLMLSGSVKGASDFSDVSPWPKFLSDDTVLWRRYVESKYTQVPEVQQAWRRPISSFRVLEPPPPLDAQQQEIVALFQRFREQVTMPDHFSSLGHMAYTNLLSKNARHFRHFLQDRYEGDIAAYSRDLQVRYANWGQVGPPLQGMGHVVRAFAFSNRPNESLFFEFKRSRPQADLIISDPDGVFWATYLRPAWSTITAYNHAHGTTYQSYEQVLLDTTVPAAELGNGQPRQDWEAFVRGNLNLAFIQIDPGALPAFAEFLRKRYENSLVEFRRAWGEAYTQFEVSQFPDPIRSSTRIRNDLAAFIKDPQACPAEALKVHGPRQMFEQFVAQERGVSVDQVAPLPLPIMQADHADFLTQRSSFRWELIQRNYLHVLEYLLINGHGIVNTLIYCTLAIVSSLVVNPLAAYALSRYKPPLMYHILLICMATMAFPGEVTMIPSFLLLKHFPLGFLLIALTSGVMIMWALARWLPKLLDWQRGLIGIGLGLLAGWWLTPLLITLGGGQVDMDVSLLNTFWALVLPGMADGFSIFLLKGFFDSLPRELYEAADLDGANEWHKFWLITMNLSKPILAVIALGAFNTAYSNFMMALVIIPDQRMWTMMVWIFQLQSFSHGSVVYASLVISAIPTLLIFLFCQNLIMRGIVVPTEK